MQPLDCYQDERHQGDSRTANHTHSRRRVDVFTTLPQPCC